MFCHRIWSDRDSKRSSCDDPIQQCDHIFCNNTRSNIIKSMAVFIFIDVFAQTKPRITSLQKISYIFNGFVLFFVCVCLLPEVGWDALSVHLFIPEYIKFFGSWSFDPNLYVFSLMPNMFVWNISIVNMLGGEALQF